MAEMGNKRLCRATAGIFHAPRRDEHLASRRGFWLELPQLFPPLSALFHPGHPARALPELKKGETMRMLGTKRGGAGGRGEEEGAEGRAGTGSLSHRQGEEEGGRRRCKEGVRGEARGRELPLSLESGFSDGNGGSAAALGQWPRSLRSPRAQRSGGRCRGAPLRCPRPGQGEGGPAAAPAAARAAGPGARKPAGRMLTSWGEGGEGRRERKAERFQHK